MEPSSRGWDSGAGGGYAFCPDTLTKDAQTTSTTSTFSIFVSARERDDRTELLLWRTHHPTSTDLFHLPPPTGLPFIFFLDCAYEHVCDTSEKGRAIARTCENVGVAECTVGADTHTSTLSALYSSKTSKPQSHFCKKPAVILDF